MIGGGGYNIWRVVPRAWSHVWFALNDLDTPKGNIPQTLLDKYQSSAPFPLPKTSAKPRCIRLFTFRFRLCTTWECSRSVGSSVFICLR